MSVEKLGILAVQNCLGLSARNVYKPALLPRIMREYAKGGSVDERQVSMPEVVKWIEDLPTE